MSEMICSDRDIVMVVDDEEAIGEMIKGLLERHGCAHVSFSDPVKALEYYEKHAKEVTLIITDLTMPYMTGSDLIKYARKINPKLPTILITGYPAEHIPEDIRPLPERILAKPFTKLELLTAVEAVLHRPPEWHSTHRAQD